MKLHLPVGLRRVLLASMVAAFGWASSSSAFADTTAGITNLGVQDRVSISSIFNSGGAFTAVGGIINVSSHVYGGTSLSISIGSMDIGTPLVPNVVTHRGQVNVTSGASASFQNLVSSADLSVGAGSSLNVALDATLGAGSVTGVSGVLNVGGVLNSAGALTVTNGILGCSDLNVTGTTAVVGKLTVSDVTHVTGGGALDLTVTAPGSSLGTVAVDGAGSTLTIAGNGNLVNAGSLGVGDGAICTVGNTQLNIADGVDLAAGSVTGITGGSLTVGGVLNSAGELTVTNGIVNAAGLNVTGTTTITGLLDVSGTVVVSGGGELTLNPTGPGGSLGDVVVTGVGSHLDINGNGNYVDADSVALRDEATGSISDVTLDVDGGRGTVTIDGASLDVDNSKINGDIQMVNNAGSLSLTGDTTVNGDVSVSAPGSDLELGDATINGELVLGGAGMTATVNGFTSVGASVGDVLVVNKGASLTVEDGGVLMSHYGTQIDSNGEVNLDANSRMDSSVTISGGALNVADGATFNGSLTFDSLGNLVQDRVANFEGDHVLTDSVNVNKDGRVNVTGGTLTVGALTGTDSSTLSLNAGVGATGTVKVTGTNNAGFASDIDMYQGTLEFAVSHEAIGSTGVLNIKGQDVTLSNATGDALVSKDISLAEAAEQVLTIDSGAEESNLVLKGTITTGVDDTIELTGSGELILADETGLSSIGTLSTGEESILGIMGTYEINELNTLGGLVIEDSTVSGGILNSSGVSFIDNSLIEMDVAVLDNVMILGDHTEIKGGVDITGALVINGENVQIATGEGTSVQFLGTGDRLLDVYKDFQLGADIISDSQADSTIAVHGGVTMQADGNLHGDTAADIIKTGFGRLCLTSDNGGTWNGLLELMEGSLQGTVSNAFGSADSVVQAGHRTLIVTGDEAKAVFKVSFDSALSVVLTGDDQLVLLETLRETDWNGMLAGTRGAIVKLGGETLRFTDHIKDNTSFDVDIVVTEGALVVNRDLGQCHITLHEGTSLAGYGSTRGDVLAAGHTSISVGDGVGYLKGHDVLTVHDLVLSGGEVGRGHVQHGDVTHAGSTTMIDLDLLSGVKGDVTHSDGSVFHNVVVGNGEKIVVNGALKLNQSVLELENLHDAVKESQVGDGTRFTVIELGKDAVHDIADTFHREIKHDLDLLNAHTENTVDGVDVVLSINHKGANKNWNQQQGSNALNQIEKGGAPVGALAEMVHEFGHTRSEAEAIESLNRAIGVGLTTTMAGMIDGNQNHMRFIRGAMGTGLSVDLSPAPDGKRGVGYSSRDCRFTNNQSMWVQGTNSYNKINGDGNGIGYSRDAWGAGLGYELALNSNWMVGAAFSYDYSRLTTDYSLGKTDAYYIDLYARYVTGNWMHRGSVGVGLYDFSVERSVDVADFHRRAKGTTNGTALNVAYELSYRFEIDRNQSISPLFTVESSLGEISGYTESGDIDNAGLVIQRQDAWATTLGLGGRYSYDFNCFSCAPRSNAFFTLLVTGEVGDQNDNIRAEFKGARGVRYDMAPARQNRLGMLMGAGTTIPFSNDWAGFGGTSVEFHEGQRDFNANLGVRYMF